MTKKSMVPYQSSKLLLPSSIKTLSGAIIDPHLTFWSFHDGLNKISLNFDRLRKFATEEFVSSSKFALIWYAENTEGVTLARNFEDLRRLLQSLAQTIGQQVSVIDMPLLASYRASLNSETEWRLGCLRAFLIRWNELGASGITDSAVRFLKSIRLKGKRKGTAVLTMNPHTGPLTDVERSAVQAALSDAFSEGKVTLGDYLLAWLSLLLGQRTVQFAMLKVCDVREVVKADGNMDYVIAVPRAKQTNTIRRAHFKERLITPSIGKLLVSYAGNVRERFESIREFSADPSQSPLFPQKQISYDERPNFFCHSTSSQIGERIKSVFDSLQVYSERTGRPIKVTSKRLRHTVATSAAREGHGELIIAELLDHSDTQNVSVYVKATPEIVERIDRAVALRMAPLAQAFAGTIIRDESEAIRGNDPSSRIVDPRFDEKLRPMGNCGRNGACGFMAPIACYTCNNFQAWVDGSHEMVLDYLIRERKRLMKDADERIATINDRTILAVADVIGKCRELQRPALDG